MRCGLPNIIEELLKILLILEYILVEIGHFGDADDLATFLQEDRYSNIFGKRKKSVEIT